ncbi:MAG: SMEK domain-containing protein [Candidatus Aminicenantes bacterium]|nr:SMEK domain-containing protein [Candidatus Aminicenantes bacterium]
MNRQTYFNSIEERLSTLATRIEMRGGLNILDLNLHAENFYLHLFNLLFGWELQNLNEIKENAPGIDLVDDTNKIIVQVSATATRQKIESALAKDISGYKGYDFKFIAISKDAAALRTKTFLNPHNLRFSPNEDIYDMKSLLKIISSLDIDLLNKVYEFLKKEIKHEPDPEKIELNLATIINVLSREDWSQTVTGFETVPYDPEIKISYNQLDTARVLIDDYKIHYHRIDKIYTDFDKQGVNKSISILDGIRNEYIALGKEVSPDQCFLSIIDKVKQKVLASANYTPIPDEELVLCVQILVVDAFIRCKIFKNPSGDADAGS